jgi:quercetin dioxygenase-like cupin family protein
MPWHSHGDRPAIICIVKGEIVVRASNCAVPIVHKTGEVVEETHATAHWWKNTGKTTGRYFVGGPAPQRSRPA